MKRPLLPLLLFIATALSAQVPAQSTQVFDHLFQTGLDDRPKVFLEKGIRYRAVLDHPAVVLQLYAPPGVQPPFVVLVGRDEDAATQLVYEIYPSHDGEVEIRLLGGDPGGATRLIIERMSPDAKASTTGQRLRLGLEVDAGLRIETTPGRKGGAVFSGCLATPETPYPQLSGCLLGFEYQPDVQLGNSHEIFIEPRFALLGGPGSGRQVVAGLSGLVGVRWRSPGDGTYIVLNSTDLDLRGGIFVQWDPAPGGVPSRWSLVVRGLSGRILTVGVIGGL